MKRFLRYAARCATTLAVIASLHMASMLPMSAPADAGILRKYVIARALVTAERRWADRAVRKAITRRGETYAARMFEREMLNPLARNSGFDALTRKQAQAIGARIQARVATREEFKRAYSQERFDNRRAKGVDEFWKQEKDRLLSQLPGSRNWSQSQLNDILAGKRPKFGGKAIEGHHTYSARSYPQIADNPRNIVPVTPREHFQKWHGGDYRPPTHGVPRNPNYPDEILGGTYGRNFRAP